MDQNPPTEVSHAPDSTTGVTDEESDSELDKNKRRNKMLAEMDPIENPFTIEDEENYVGEYNWWENAANENWHLPTEGFSHRHEITDR